MTWLFAFASALTSIMNPIGTTGMFAGMVADRTKAETKAIAWKAALAIFVILLISTWAGDLALSLVGINVHELRAAGGIIVTIIGLRMLFNDSSHAQTAPEANAAKHRESIAVVPVAIPLVAGPGTISLVIAHAGQHPAVLDRCYISLVCLTLALVTGLLFSIAPRIARWLGVSGMAVVTRVMGMVLVSIAMGMMVAGIKGLFPEFFPAQ